MLFAAQGFAGLGEKHRAHQRQIRDRMAGGIVDVLARGILDATTFLGLLAIGPLVVAGRVDQRITELTPEIHDPSG